MAATGHPAAPRHFPALTNQSDQWGVQDISVINRDHSRTVNESWMGPHRDTGGDAALLLGSASALAACSTANSAVQCAISSANGQQAAGQLTARLILDLL
jgi:hypothetical protein